MNNKLIWIGGIGFVSSSIYLGISYFFKNKLVDTNLGIIVIFISMVILFLGFFGDRLSYWINKFS